jgi:hypothetical protein
MQSKPNPYLNNLRSKVKPKARVVMTAQRKNARAHYGSPIQLFKDSDRDGVMNVFDCKPHNQRKQDVISPMSGSPVQDMYSRMENARLQALYQKQLEEMRQLEAERIAELQRLNTVTIDNTITVEKWITSPSSEKDNANYFNSKTQEQQANIILANTGKKSTLGLTTAQKEAIIKEANNIRNTTANTTAKSSNSKSFINTTLPKSSGFPTNRGTVQTYSPPVPKGTTNIKVGK